MFFFFNDTATTEIYTLSLHDALPICQQRRQHRHLRHLREHRRRLPPVVPVAHHSPRQDRAHARPHPLDRKSTRLNSSHANISYAVFCLKKKNKYLTIISSSFVSPAAS